MRVEYQEIVGWVAPFNTPIYGDRIDLGHPDEEGRYRLPEGFNIQTGRIVFTVDSPNFTVVAKVI